MRMPLAVVVSCCLCLLFVPHVSGWGFKGHRVIGELAQRRLANRNPDVLTKIAELVGPGVKLSTLSTCADDIRDYMREREKGQAHPPFPGACLLTPAEVESRFRQTASWHFVNIPVPAAANGAHPDSALAAACPAAVRCITSQIDYFTGRLKNKTLSKKDRAVALMFLTHLIGDIHQPLHAVARNQDQGGNLVFVRIGSHTSKLHSAWDTFLVERKGSAILSEQELVDSLSNSPLDGTIQTSNRSANAWAWESYDIARKIVYRDVPLQPTTFEQPIIVPHPGYRDRAVSQIRKRLYAASVRLADTLVEALDQP